MLLGQRRQDPVGEVQGSQACQWLAVIRTKSLSPFGSQISHQSSSALYRTPLIIHGAPSLCVDMHSAAGLLLL